MENQNNNQKKGLQFLEFHKIRKTKDGKNVLSSSTTMFVFLCRSNILRKLLRLKNQTNRKPPNGGFHFQKGVFYELGVYHSKIVGHFLAYRHYDFRGVLGEVVNRSMDDGQTCPSENQ